MRRRVLTSIKEEMRFLSRAVVGREPIHEKLLGSVAAEINWGRQQRYRLVRPHTLSGAFETLFELFHRDKQRDLQRVFWGPIETHLIV